MDERFEKARKLLRAFKGERYAFGDGALARVGEMVAALEGRAGLVRGSSEASRSVAQQVAERLTGAGVGLLGQVRGARPNAPRADVLRMAEDLRALDPDLVVAVEGGSVIDAAKAAEVLRTLGGDLEDYFGTGEVTAALARRGLALSPLVAVQMAASSSAHLTKYSNVTDLATAQKKLIVDEAIVPARAVFQYDVTATMGRDLTLDGAFDGLSHMLEVYYGAVGKPFYSRVQEIASVGIALIVHHVERAAEHPEDLEAREALGLATDLGGYAIMVGGTNGGHLTSFSLVDVLSHGRACMVMNPYYTVFFAPAIQEPLRVVGRIFRLAGLSNADIDALSGRDLGMAVAEAMQALLRRVGFPTALSEVGGFSQAHIDRALTAAKNPQLKMKLENMPVPLAPEMVDEYMGPVLEAARDGDLTRVKNVPPHARA
jgi:alcohol dehydrogenase class IV